MAKATQVVPLFDSKRDVRSKGTVEVQHPAPEEFIRLERGGSRVYVLGKTMSGEWGYIAKDGLD